MNVKEWGLRIFVVVPKYRAVFIVIEAGFKIVYTRSRSDLWSKLLWGRSVQRLVREDRGIIWPG